MEAISWEAFSWVALWSELSPVRAVQVMREVRRASVSRGVPHNDMRRLFVLALAPERAAGEQRSELRP